jgi:tetratricopeptide (TPR) repeat protein
LTACASARAASVDELIEANHWKQAYQIASSRISQNPADAQAHAWMSKIKATFGDLAASLAEAQKAVDLDPRNAQFHAQLSEACALTADVAHVLTALPYVHCMKREVDRTLSIDPRNIDTRLVYMMFSWKAPSIAGGDHGRAKKIAEEIGHISPAWGYLALARLLQDLDNDGLKEDLLQKAVAADPKFYRARMALATFYAVNAKQKRFDLAEREAHAMQGLDPSNEGAYEILARIYASESRWQELEDVLVQSARQAPDDATPFYAAAETLSDSNIEIPRAERFLARYLGQAPEGRQPTHAKARWLLARLYAKEGKMQEAVKELQVSLRLDPQFEPAAKDLKKLLRS